MPMGRSWHGHLATLSSGQEIVMSADSPATLMTRRGIVAIHGPEAATRVIASRAPVNHEPGPGHGGCTAWPCPSGRL